MHRKERNSERRKYTSGLSRGCGSLVVKVTDSCPKCHDFDELMMACHEFEPSTAEDVLCKGAMPVKSLEDQTSSSQCGVEIRKGGTPAKVPPSSLDHGSKL
ncbi:hypothetical protein TNCV_3079381 [Trichonephila clavipes]|nr:hypothetical protein TNCV_3079381 [Trichonephila clavipes]